MSTPATADGPDTVLSAAEQQRALDLSVIDGVLYALMVGIGEVFFIPNAIRLGASPVELGLTITVPLLIGSLGPLVMLRRLASRPRRRPVVVLGTLSQAAILIGVIGAGNAFAFLSPIALIVALCVYQIGGQIAGVAWSSWYGDVVPVAVRGRWFARRTRLVHLATFVGIVIGGLCLHALEPGAGAPDGGVRLGFAVIALIAGVCRLASCRILHLSPEPRLRGTASRRHLGRFLVTSRGRNISFLLAGTAVFHLTVYVASPFFTPFMLDVLSLDYIEFTVATGVQVGIKVVSMPYWGRLVDHYGARRTYTAAIGLAAAVPLPWLFVSGNLGVYLAQMFSGLAWSAHEVTLFALVLESSRRDNRPQIYALQALCNAVGQVGGSLIGGALIGATTYWTVFLVSLLGRGLVAIVLPMQIRELRLRPGAGREPMVLRIIGYRPGGGVTHRPVFPRNFAGADIDDGAEPGEHPVE